MRHILMAIIVTAILIIVQVSLFVYYPFALISFCAWIWWKGFRSVLPWAAITSVVLDLYSNAFGSTLFEWAIILTVIAVVSSTILTNRSMFALLVVALSGFVLGSMLHWGIWYLLWFVFPYASPLNVWYDINLVSFGISLLFTALYAIVLWFIFSGGKRGRRVFLVSDQMI